MSAYAGASFLGAFLIFVIQPILGRFILPWFGGTAQVWSVCMVFFQVALLAGYGYSRWLSAQSGRRILVHGVILAAAAVMLPPEPGARWKPGTPDHPVGQILLLLAATIGLAFVGLAATSPLLQVWATRRDSGSVARAMKLYAWSNAGSLAALIAYPTLIEPNFDLGVQAVGWGIAFVLFAVVMIGLAWRASKETGPVGARPSPRSADERAPLARRLHWAGLSACGVILLLGATQQMCQEVAVVPFLWILPLSLYLASLIVVFAFPNAYRRALGMVPLIVGLGGLYLGIYAVTAIGAVTAIAVLAAGLFLCCWVCHGELVRLRPSAEGLADFYFMLALGGAVGGVLVGLLAPSILPFPFELQIGMAAVVSLTTLARESAGAGVRGGIRPSPAYRMVGQIVALALLFMMLSDARKALVPFRLVERNFYGTLKVADFVSEQTGLELRQLVHGITNHGQQFRLPALDHEPTAYYGRESGGGLLLGAEGRSPWRVGLVGLGVGTLATYGRSGDVFRFFELDPAVIRLANTEFSFVRDSAARVETVAGDARLSLERDSEGPYDAIVVDAFSSDAIPIHLLTAECFDLYVARSTPRAVFAFNVSNRTLDLQSVLAALAASKGWRAFVVHSPGDGLGVLEARWVLLARSAADLPSDRLRELARPLEMSDTRHRPWTDRRSDPFGALK